PSPRHPPAQITPNRPCSPSRAASPGRRRPSPRRRRRSRPPRRRARRAGCPRRAARARRPRRAAARTRTRAATTTARVSCASSSAARCRAARRPPPRAAANRATTRSRARPPPPAPRPPAPPPSATSKGRRPPRRRRSRPAAADSSPPSRRSPARRPGRCGGRWRTWTSRRRGGPRHPPSRTIRGRGGLRCPRCTRTRCRRPCSPRGGGSWPRGKRRSRPSTGHCESRVGGIVAWICRDSLSFIAAARSVDGRAIPRWLARDGRLQRWSNTHTQQMAGPVARFSAPAHPSGLHTLFPDAGNLSSAAADLTGRLRSSPPLFPAILSAQDPRKVHARITSESHGLDRSRQGRRGIKHFKLIEIAPELATSLDKAGARHGMGATPA
ncbi:hypothetical protein DFJ74DRAFT_210809, partial [Hyaloraphidium curvatum]